MTVCYEYKGILVGKYREDMDTILKIIDLVRPDFVIELGTFYGGSAYEIADHMMPWNGKVITVDEIESRIQPEVKQHPNIIFVQGNTTLKETAERVKPLIHGIVLVDIDANHNVNCVQEDLINFYEMVTPGSYLIVEDGSIDRDWTELDKRIYPHGGPLKAIEWFLKLHPEFEVIRSWETNPTNNPKGYLRRKVNNG